MSHFKLTHPKLAVLALGESKKIIRHFIVSLT
jgi:hypothetical protein